MAKDITLDRTGYPDYTKEEIEIFYDREIDSYVAYCEVRVDKFHKWGYEYVEKTGRLSRVLQECRLYGDQDFYSWGWGGVPGTLEYL